MSISYNEANTIAKECEYKEGMICSVRSKYRDCDRPLCCGYCPTIDECENVCALILKIAEQTKNNRT